ncbi:hypothetical protein L1887_28666 [Cichorium endivia]|nr:hypothetical protein L1887_28666 [Cichorium endivia]
MESSGKLSQAKSSSQGGGQLPLVGFPSPYNKLPSITWRSILLWVRISQCECVDHRRVSPSSLPNTFFLNFTIRVSLSI